MPNSCTPVYLHFVWATEDRRPLIVPEWEANLHACIAAKCRKLGCLMVEINGMADHIHVLVRMPGEPGYATLAKEMKGSSSHIINHQLAPQLHFRWHAGYYCRSVDPGNVETVRAYIRNQKRHHTDNTTVLDWERAEE